MKETRRGSVRTDQTNTINTHSASAPVFHSPNFRDLKLGQYLDLAARCNTATNQLIENFKSSRQATGTGGPQELWNCHYERLGLARKICFSGEPPKADPSLRS